MELLKDKIAVVTGGSRGIGAAVCLKLGSAGALVVINYCSSKEPAESVASQIIESGGQAVLYQADVTDSAGVTKMADELFRTYGKIDILVNNAGIIRDGLLLTMTDDNWHQVIDTNLGGVARCTRAFGRYLMLTRKGVIINISSVSGRKPGRGQANYAASKGGIEALTKAMAVELAKKKVRVNGVAPGVIRTDMSAAVRNVAEKEILSEILLKRLGEPDDIAEAVLFLASDKASYITGQVLAVDGGFKM